MGRSLSAGVDSRDEREAALAALSRWRDERAWARRDPATLAIEGVEAAGPVQVVLTSIFEGRGVRYRLVAAPRRATLNEPGPDPWAYPLEHPANAPVGHELTEVVEEHRVHMDCGMCSAMGDMSCPRCGGMGRIQQGKHSRTCPRCGGAGQIICEQCGGSGGLYGHPTVWSRIQRCEVRRAHETDGLPNAVFLALSGEDRGGDVFHEQEGEHIIDYVRGGGYRDAAGSSDSLRQLVQKVCEAPGLPDGARLIRQRLELRRVPVWRLTLEGGNELWVYGDPPEVSPEGALRSTAARAATVAPLAVAAGGAAYALYWLFG